MVATESAVEFPPVVEEGVEHRHHLLVWIEPGGRAAASVRICR